MVLIDFIGMTIETCIINTQVELEVPHGNTYERKATVRLL